jgi:hypothetical protein
VAEERLFSRLDGEVERLLDPAHSPPQWSVENKTSTRSDSEAELKNLK